MQNIDTIDTVYAIDAIAAETGQATATISDLVKLIQATYALANESDVIKYFDLAGLVGATYDAEGNQIMEDGEFFAEFDNWFK